MTLAERLWSKVEIKNGHWLWTRATDRNGYGMIGRGRRGEGMIFTHRAAWEVTYGPIPEGMNVLHHCDIPLCCRPECLFLGTQIDNLQDMISKGRHGNSNKTHCPADHPYDEINTYINPSTGGRRCRTCKRIQSRESARRIRARKPGES